MASSSPGVRSWRTAFLTLRDETLSSPPPTAVLGLLRTLVLSHPSPALVAAAAQLPPHEVASDVILLAELASVASECPGASGALIQICHLIHDIICKIHLEISSVPWNVILNFCQKILNHLLGETDTSSSCIGHSARGKVTNDIFGLLRQLCQVHGPKCSLPESIQLLGLLLSLISCLHAELLIMYRSSDSQSSATHTGKGNPECKILWETQTIAFSMLGDALLKLGSAVPATLWQCVLEGLRRTMDFLASKNLIIEDYVMSRFYASLLHCLHLVLSDAKGSFSVHVTGFVSTLQKFFTYGLPNRSSLPSTAYSTSKRYGSPNLNSGLPESSNNGSGRYKPPHLRRKDEAITFSIKAVSSSDADLLKFNLTSSDSEHSDSDGFPKCEDRYRGSKVRLSAINCIQDICHIDPKSLTSLWTMLLPENDVLQPRRFQATLMTCLLFDPISKIRIAAASTLAAMLDEHSLFFLQVAEYRESTKCGSFTTLSSSLGQILMQLHRGTLYLIQIENQHGLLAPSFKLLLFLISATPYARMPGELLVNVISLLHMKILKDLSDKHMGVLGAALSCLEAAFSRSPSSSNVQKLLEDISTGDAHMEQGTSVPKILLGFSEQGRHPSIRFEALQALKALTHNYPSVVTPMWETISSVVKSWLQTSVSNEFSSEGFSSSWKGDNGKTPAPSIEKCIMAGIKLLDECLRVASGFKGTELMDNIYDCGQEDVHLLSHCSRNSGIPSPGSHRIGGPDALESDTTCLLSGYNEWLEVIENHLPLGLSHGSPMVRAASVTCFAGLTLPVFILFTEDNQEFIISSSVMAATNDEVSYVRSAACRAIGVIAGFPHVVSCPRLLNEFIYAAELNTRDPILTVRITASWALANICYSLRHRVTTSCLQGASSQVIDPEALSFLVESTLKLTKDGDKVKSNAVRALGNLSRFIQFSYDASTKNGSFNYTSFNRASENLYPLLDNAYKAPSSIRSSDWLERMVQAFVSCVTTGNVKVQWNVCHALGNLFMNETLNLSAMPWASSVYSILLLLLRDSTNFKIRIQAAVSLGMPASRLDYGNSFPDIVQSLVHALESLGSVEASVPTGFKYKDNLEKQVTLTALHVLGFVSPDDDQAFKDFLIKKVSFLVDWLHMLCSSLKENADQPSTSKKTSSENQRDTSTPIILNNATVLEAVKSLMDVYKSSKNQSIAQRLEKIIDNLS